MQRERHCSSIRSPARYSPLFVQNHMFTVTVTALTGSLAHGYHSSHLFNSFIHACLLLKNFFTWQLMWQFTNQSLSSAENLLVCQNLLQMLVWNSTRPSSIHFVLIWLLWLKVALWPLMEPNEFSKPLPSVIDGNEAGSHESSSDVIWLSDT